MGTPDKHQHPHPLWRSVCYVTVQGSTLFSPSWQNHDLFFNNECVKFLFWLLFISKIYDILHWSFETNLLIWVSNEKKSFTIALSPFLQTSVCAFYLHCPILTKKIKWNKKNKLILHNCEFKSIFQWCLWTGKSCERQKVLYMCFVY